MDCLDANAVQDLMSGALDSTARKAVLGHLDGCDDCRELLSVTAADTLKGIAFEATYALLGETMASSAGIGDKAIAAEQVAGNKLGRYTLEERLGAGAMGVVWRAADPTLGRAVAVKVLRRADDALTERLVREAQSMAQVNHPNVVTVYEVGEATDGTTFIAMELVAGQSLRSWQKGKQHTIPELVEAYIAAARGLAAAHAAGIVHRDFKPDNVLVGDDGRVRVTDFGLAAAKPEAGRPTSVSDINLTTSGLVLGTPAYMAPEQFTGGNVDPRTDQFNFCVALYEALYGERPFDGTSFQELRDAVCARRIKQPPARNPVSAALRDILLRGLAPKPGDRFATMNELIVELGRDRAKPWRRTSMIAAALAGVLAIGLCADWIVRDRVNAEIRQSFALTRSQLDKTVGRLTNTFYKISEAAYRESALRQVAGHHDQADFGLGSPEADRADLEELHNTLASTDWVRLEGTTLAIADYKGRLLYSSAAPSALGADLTGFDVVKSAINTGKGDSVTVLSSADPRLAPILGKQSAGVTVLFERTLALGDKSQGGSEARVLYLQLQDGKHLLDEIQLDEHTKLALVAPDGTWITNNEMPASLVAAGRPADGYEVQSFPVRGLDDGEIARVVMARPVSAVLSLFPGARLVFALTMIVAIMLAGYTAWRARMMTGATV
jgi:serine/threonine protein kinase